jgi:hypothetical protein
VRRAFALAAVIAAASGPVQAQTKTDLVRFEWLSGLLLHGTMADVTFQLDTTPFGGVLIERSGGTMDVDPAFAYGLRASYRLGPRFQILGSWLHSEGRYRVLFPALAQDEGDFDLEALLLAGFDFAGPQTRVAHATSLSKTDVYAATLRYEFPVLDAKLFPFFSAGGGIYRERSDGNVFRLDFAGEVPASIQIAALAGVDPLAGSGISVFSIDATDVLVSLGGGLRASISEKWGVQFEIEDLIRVNADLTHLDATSTPPPDATSFRLYQTTFRGRDGIIHNPSVRVALNYALWPFDEPR